MECPVCKSPLKMWCPMRDQPLQRHPPAPALLRSFPVPHLCCWETPIAGPFSPSPPALLMSWSFCFDHTNSPHL
uniref:Uncharacterized protein n=1 Tax=Triticum urartu TaxID=4572 RepID=A0A8R7QBE2_TRIUA